MISDLMVTAAWISTISAAVIISRLIYWRIKCEGNERG
jgi:hypothetical protein